jgi:hypothetical protein
MAVEFSDVDKSIVMAGGVTTANLPQRARNFRRSSSSGVPISTDGSFWPRVIFIPSKKIFSFLAVI